MPTADRTLRIGVAFQDLTATDEATLTRFVFEDLRRDARKRRHLPDDQGGAPGGLRERRRARRVYPEKQNLSVYLEDFADRQLTAVEQVRILAAATGEWEVLGEVELSDVCANGCGFFSRKHNGLKAGAVVEIHLLGEGVDLRVHGRVVYVRKRPRRRRR